MTAREHINRFVETSIRTGWPTLLLIAIFIPMYYGANAWLNAEQMAKATEVAMQIGWVATKLAGVMFGAMFAFGAATIVMALQTGTRTLRQVAWPTVGAASFFVLAIAMLVA